MDIHKNARTTPYPRAGIARRVIVEGQTADVVAAAFGVCALDHFCGRTVQVAGAVEPRVGEKTRDFDDERVAFPVTDRLAHP